MTNLEGRVILRQAVRQPPPGVRTDLDVMRELAERLGVGASFAFRCPSDAFDELRVATSGARADYSGITYERIRARARRLLALSGRRAPGHAAPLRGPLRAPERPRAVQARGVSAGGRAAGRAVPALLHDGPLPGALQLGRADPTRRAARGRAAPAAPADESAARREARHRRGRRWSSSRAGAAPSSSPSSCPKTSASTRVFAPFHWGGKRAANVLTIGALDPTSRMPEFKVCAVRARPAAAGLARPAGR